ncbi:MAG: S1 RNA-binding domain-containing protein [Ardenticatenaceae bacterium]|nr:S1 RNA-binding domain-containing protein [Ardenticatenaceae bacterium]
MEVEQTKDLSLFLDQLSEYDFSLRIPEAGELYTGTVVSKTNDAILVDIGAKSEGMIDRREIEQLSPEQKNDLAEGNEIKVVVITPEDRNGNIILSYTKAMEDVDWVRAEELLESGEVFSSEVIGFNRGGLLARLGTLRAFIPVSHVGFSVEDSTEFEKLIGDQLPVKVLEVNRNKRRLILSARETMQKQRAEKKREALSTLTEGDKIKGPIVNIESFGLFVDLDGIQGLVHLSEVSWQRIDNLKKHFQQGQEVEVLILQIDEEKARVSLSMKRLEVDPWDEIEKYYRIGQLIEVSITKVVPFGAFARLNGEFELEGLIHISELADHHVQHPHEVIKANDTMVVRIIKINNDKRQIGLSLKQVSSSEFIDVDLEQS